MATPAQFRIDTVTHDLLTNSRPTHAVAPPARGRALAEPVFPHHPELRKILPAALLLHSQPQSRVFLQRRSGPGIALVAGGPQEAPGRCAEFRGRNMTGRK